MFLASAHSAVAQKRNSKITEPTITLNEALTQYRFSEAEELLLAEIEAQGKKKQSTDALEEKLHAVEKAKARLNATEKVVFIDSLVVPKAELFQHLQMSDEVGSVASYASFFGQDGQPDLSVFLSQMKDKLYYSDRDENGRIRIFTKDMEGGSWSDPSPVRGLEEQDDLHQNYPFVLSDGVTLYYAAQGSESIGGYDIFMTRYDADDHTFLMPENIGMPFNSPANDYLYMLDDYLNLGWFVTDRNQPADMVCIYTFIPNETRKVYRSDAISAEQLRSFARLNSIRDTWQNRNEVEEALAKVAKIRQEGNHAQANANDLHFIITDQVTYHRLEDFKNPEARKNFEFLREGQKQLAELEQNLERMRDQYARSGEDVRLTLKSKILQAEQTLKGLRQNLAIQEKEIRKLEAGT